MSCTLSSNLSLATISFCASYMMSPMLSLGPHSAPRASGASRAFHHTNCDKKSAANI